MEQFFIQNPEYANSGIRNKNIYLNWNKLALDTNAEFEGIHNGFCANIKTIHPFERGKIQIITSRQLQSAAGTVLPKIAKITTFTYVLKSINYSSPIIKIRPKSFISSFLYLFNFDKCKNLKFNSKYFIQTTDLDKCTKLLSLPFLQNIIKHVTLGKFVVNPSKRTISITFCKVFEEESAIKDLLSFLDGIDEILTCRI